MISIVLLLKIVAGISIVLCWAYVWRLAVRTEQHLECLKEHYDARLSDFARQVDMRETEPGAKEAERRFSEGVASILNYSHRSAGAEELRTAAEALIPGQLTGNGRKGD